MTQLTEDVQKRLVRQFHILGEVALMLIKDVAKVLWV